MHNEYAGLSYGETQKLAKYRLTLKRALRANGIDYDREATTRELEDMQGVK